MLFPNKAYLYATDLVDGLLPSSLDLTYLFCNPVKGSTTIYEAIKLTGYQVSSIKSVMRSYFISEMKDIILNQ